MPVNYLPADAVNIGTLEHDQHQWQVRLHAASKTVYLLPVECDQEPRPERECPPAAVAYCHEWTRPSVVLYSERLYIRARRNRAWLAELTDKIAWTVKPHLQPPE
ncbi:hypothetical protein [Haloglycomyces albus]|uniref:hypothetical protein n=1 Tax=Haloglycomyces albus TaxID=526067 RepID=UPI00046C9D26|nr:hypothetical protein [Haloglycomyces albus]